MSTVAIRRATELDRASTRTLIDAVLAVIGIWAAVIIVKAIVAALAQVVGVALLGYLLLAQR